MPATTVLHAITPDGQRREPWANGAGETRVLLREPDDANWRVRISVARVDAPCVFSELVATRRILVPLDGACDLQFPDGRTRHAARMHAVRFDGAPAPRCELPDGPTRDFNLMLRDGAQGELLARPLVGSMMLLPERGVRWLVYVHAGQVRAVCQAAALELAAGDAALLAFDPGSPQRAAFEGGGEIVLAKLYA